MSPVVVERLTLDQARPKMAAVAGWLTKAGLGPGDRVTFCCTSSAELLLAVLGASLVGIVPVMLNANLLDEERDVLRRDASAAHEVLDATSLHELFSGPLIEVAELPLTRPMLFTSGTTGHPKGVFCGVWSEDDARRVFEDEQNVWGFSASDVHLINSPLYHSVATRFASGTLFSGGEVVVTSRFDSATVLNLLRANEITTTFMVPTHLQRLFGDPSFEKGETFDALRLVAHAGAACPTPLKLQAIETFGVHALYEFYGATEGQFTVCSTPEWRERPGTVGRARPGRRLFLRPPDDQEDLDEGVGAIWCEVPPYARFEYFGDPVATADAWDGDAFSVGDLGTIDEDGYLYLSGRRSDLIITGGVNVYPAEIEDTLLHFPGLAEVCVFGREDDQWGQRVCAAVVADRGISNEDLDRFAHEHLAPHKRPKEYHVVSDLPVGPTGKVMRRHMLAHLGLDGRA